MYHRLHASFWRRAFTATAIAWVVLLFAATYTSSAAAHGDAAYAGATLVYLLSSLICHQRPERSFHLWGAQLPVCARCLGVYAGAACSAIVAGAAARPAAAMSRAALPVLTLPGAVQARTTVLWWLVAAAPTAATLGFEWTTGTTPSNPIRAAAGAPLGALVAWTVMRVR